jgi:CrcB protein
VAAVPAGVATRAVNAVGCALLGFVTGRVRSTLGRALIGAGLSGALTTFSGFAVETVTLVEQSALAAGAYLCASLASGTVCAVIGLRLGRQHGGEQPA